MFSSVIKACKVVRLSKDTVTYETVACQLSSAEKVFKLDELRENILKYVICEGNNGQLSETMLKNLRLVNKHWLQTTSRLLRKYRKAVIFLKLDVNNVVEETEEFTGNRLDQLVSTHSNKLEESFLPVKLDLTRDFFRKANYQSLSNFLTHQGSFLLELEIEFPKCGGTMPVTFSSFTLPYMQKLTFKFSENELSSQFENDEGFGDNRNGLWLFQSILNASNIKELTVPFVQNGGFVPVDFKYLQLPFQIKTLEISLILTNDDIKLLLKSLLPHLTHLILQLSQIPFEEGVLFKILERFRKTLEVFRLDGLESVGHLWLPTLLKFPLMEKLKKLTVASIECELGPELISDLQKQLPKLKVAFLEHQTILRLEKWIMHSRFENVLQLWVSMINDRLEEANESFFISPTSQTLNQLRQAFPNVRYLGLTININDISVLRYLFANAFQLYSLNITFAGNETSLNTSSDLIDSIFLGMPLNLISVIKESSEYLETIVFKYKEPSLLNLTALKTLVLRNKLNAGANPIQDPAMTLISDMLFRHVFLQMKSLRNLVLVRKFKPALEMEAEWRKRGGFISYSDI